MKDLKPGIHRVFIQSGSGKFNKNPEIPIENKYAKYWNKSLGQVVGWLTGDGWLRTGDKNCRVGFTFAEDDKEVLGYLKPIINRMYGKDIKEVKRKSGVTHLSYHGKSFAAFFEKLGAKPVKADEKAVPESIFTATEDAVIGFLQGVFTADGTIGIHEPSQNYYIRLTSKSKKLLKQVQLLLLNLGASIAS